MKAGAGHRVNHLLHRDALGIESDHGFFRTKAHVRPIHALQPFQGLLDRDRSAASRHPLHREDDRRRRGQRAVRNQRETEEERQDRRRAAAHRLPPMSCPS